MRAPAGMTAEAQSAADFLSRRLGQKGGTRETSRSSSSSSIDPIDQCLVERDIELHRPTGIGKQGNGEQHGSGLNGRGHILLEQNLVDRARQRHASACALDTLHMLTQRTAAFATASSTVSPAEKHPSTSGNHTPKALSGSFSMTAT